MKYLLDTNAVIALMRGHPGFLARLQQRLPEDFGLPVVVMHELFYGAYKSQRRAENLMRVSALQFAVVDFDGEDARLSGELRAQLAAVGTPIGGLDVLIAAQALARDLTLVTHNTREFRIVPSLRVEDWE